MDIVNFIWEMNYALWDLYEVIFNFLRQEISIGSHTVTMIGLLAGSGVVVLITLSIVKAIVPLV